MLVHSFGFGVKESIAAMRLYVEKSRTVGQGLLEVTFMTNFPKKVSGDEEYGTSLKNLVLMPSSAVLMMTKWKKYDN